jgi:hypothetical protein
MISNTVGCNTIAEVEQIHPERYTAPLDGAYVTAPMAAVLPVDQPSSEEELHSSFEEAISGRLLAVNNRLDRLSSMSHPVVAYRQTGTFSVVSGPLFLTQPPVLRHPWRKILIGVALVCICVLIGFDLMGLLVLYMH